MPRFTSHRTQAMPESIFGRMDAAKSAARARGLTVIDLSIGSSDLPPPTAAINALREAATDPSTYGYCLASGTRPLREAAVAWFHTRYGMPLDADANALPLIGGQEGFANLLLAITDPGDAILMPDPCYPSYFGAVAIAGVEAIPMPLLPEHGFRPDLNGIRPSDAARAKALVLNYPNNPTAGVADAHYFDQALAFCNQHDLLLIHDFPYVDMVDTEEGAPSVLTRPGALDRAIELYTASKSFHLAGFRVGFALGNRDAIAALARVKSAIDFNPYLGLQRALVAALAQPRERTRQDALVYATRRHAMVTAMNHHGWPTEAPAAGMYLWARIPARAGALARDSIAFCDALVRETGVALNPGRAFGSYGEGYARMALVREPDALQTAARAIGTFLDSLA